MKILVVILILIGVVGLTQLLKIYRLSAELNGKREEDISEAENNMNARLFLLFMVVYYVTTIWQVAEFGLGLGPAAASVHGLKIDSLLTFNWWIIGAVFFLVHTLLFIFAYKFKYSKDRKAEFYAHDNKLELIWTSVPTVVLAVIIIWGLNLWNDITDEPAEDAVKMELYAKQFDWTARYAGKDGKLGLVNYNLITGTNPLGLVTEDAVKASLEEVEASLADMRAVLKKNQAYYSADKIAELESAIESKRLHRNRILQINTNDPRLAYADDDILVKSEFHLPVDREVDFQFRSRDVIHSALMHQFRAQMNCVPGTVTKFHFTPNKTTEQARAELKNPEYNYMLTCNKICGASHWNMTMNIVVDKENKFNNWLKEQKTFVAKN